MQQCHACDAINPKHWSIINWLSEMLVYLCAEHYLPPKNWGCWSIINFYIHFYDDICNKIPSVAPWPGDRTMKLTHFSFCDFLKVRVTLCTLCSSTVSVTQRSLGATVLFCNRCVCRRDMSSPSRSPTVPPLLTVRYWPKLCRCNTWGDQRTSHPQQHLTSTNILGKSDRGAVLQNSFNALFDAV